MFVVFLDYIHLTWCRFGQVLHKLKVEYMGWILMRRRRFELEKKNPLAFILAANDWFPAFGMESMRATFESTAMI